MQNATWFIDIGAGAGEMCILAATYPRMKRIVAVDANPVETAKVHENIAHNSMAGRIEVITKYAGPDNSATTVALDTLELPDGQGFIKIDVDGAELDVLKGCHRLLTQREVALLIETHSAALERDCISLLRGLGYVCTVIPQAWWRVFLPEQRVIEHNRWFFGERQR